MAKAGTYNSNAKMSEELETTEPIYHSPLFQVLVLLLILVSIGRGDMEHMETPKVFSFPHLVFHLLSYLEFSWVSLTYVY